MLSRRDFLRSSALGALGVALAACSKKGGAKTIDDVLAGRRQALSVQWTHNELLARPSEHFTFQVLDPATQAPVGAKDGSVWFGANHSSPAIGPFPIRAMENGLDAKGLFTSNVTVPSNGTYTAVVETGGKIGVAQVMFGHTISNPIPGEHAISVATPTVKDHRGVEPYCTRKPKPCSMHAISLDQALLNGKPTVLIIATPAFCTSQLCGPEVELLQGIAARAGARANFIHIEVYRNDKPDTIQRQLTSPGATAWKLEDEPAIYFIGSDGIIKDRTIGPVDAREMSDATNALLA